LVNVRGELIGINTAILSRNGGGNQGVGFAVPVNMAMAVTDQIMTTGHVVRGWLGVTIQPVTASVARAFDLEEPRGALVGDVVPASPAEEGGILQGDIILEIDGKQIEDSRQLRLQVAMLRPGTEAIFSVFREGNTIEVPITLGELEEDVAIASTGGAEKGSAEELLEGVSVQELTPQLRRQLELGPSVDGLVVSRVDGNSAAYRAGLRRGDVIEEINRTPVTTTRQYEAALRQQSDSILLLVNRNGGSLYLVVEK
jgi:serine protease Do